MRQNLSNAASFGLPRARFIDQGAGEVFATSRASMRSLYVLPSRSVYRVRFIVPVLILFFMGTSALAQKNSIASGNYDNPAIWNPAGVPNGAELVVINPGHTVTLTASTANTSLTRVNGILVMAGFNLNTGDLDGTGTIQHGSGTPILTVGGSNTPNSFTGTLTGALSFVKTGSDVFTLSGTNTYTGTTQVQQGTLRIINGTALGSSSAVTVTSGATLALDGGFTLGRNITINGTGVGGNGALQNTAGTNILTSTVTLASASTIGVSGGSLELTNATAIAMAGNELTFNNSTAVTIGGSITGTADFTKEGSGVLTLTGSNTFSGNKIINAGAINVQNAGALGTLGSITVNSGGAIQFQADVTFARPITINGTGVSNTGAIRNISGTNALTGLITLGSAARINSDAGTLQLSATTTSVSSPNLNLTFGGGGAISVTTALSLGSGAVTKDGGGTTTFLVSNTYTGGTTISDGAINIQNAGALGASGTITVNNGGTLQLQNNITFARAITINGNGDGSNTGAIRSVSGTNIISATITLASAARINTDAGTLTLSAANSVTATNQALTLGGAANTTVSGTITIGSGALNKDGNGTATISVANTFTGNTNISAGALIPVVANALGTSGTVVITSNGTLQLQNAMTFARPINLGSNVAVGGIRLVTNNVTLSGLITLTAASRINADASTLTFNNANELTGTNQTLTLGGAGNMIFNRAITTTTGGLTKVDAGTVTLNVPNEYTGTTTVSGGTLIYGANNIVATGNLTVTGGTLNIQTFNDTVAVFSVTGGSVTGTGTIFAQGDYSFSGTATISVNLGGDVGLNKVGGGVTTLSGTNSFTGQVWIQNGTLEATTINTWPSPSATSNLGSPSSAANATIRLGSGGGTGTLRYLGAAFSCGRDLELSGTTGGGGIVNNGSGALVWNGAMTASGSGNKAFTLGGTNTADNIFNANIPNGPTGATSLTKSDAGRWVLPNAKTNTGNSTIAAGTLLIQDGGALGAAGTVSISASAALEMEGGITLNQNITLAGAPPITGAIRSMSGNNTIGGTITATANTTHRIQVEAGSQLTYAGTPAFDHSSRTVTFQGAGNHVVPNGSNFIGSTGALTKEGSGTLFMNGSKFTTGTTTIAGGSIVLGGNNRFDAASLLQINNAGSTFDLNGFSQTVNGIAGTSTASIITSSAAGTCSLIINNTAARTFNGQINDGSGVITVRKLGTGDQTLGYSSSNYTGQTYIGGGRLIVSNSIQNSGTNSTIGRGTSSPAIVLEGGGTLTYSGGTARSTNRAFQIIGTGTIEMSGNATLTLQGGVTSSGGTVTFNTSGGTSCFITVNTSPISLGAGGIVKTGSRTLNINIASSYTGSTDIQVGTLAVGVANALPTTTTLINNATLNMNGFNVTVASIEGTTAGAAVRSNVAGAVTFTMNRASGTYNYQGTIINGSGTVSVTKEGAYTQVFGGNNTYSGDTDINGGILRANSNTAFSNGSVHVLANVAGVELDMTGYDMTISSLAGGGTTGGLVRLGTAALTLAGNGSFTYSGRILGEGIGGGLIKQGTGVFTLSRSPEFEGFTRIRQGTLRAGADLNFVGNLIISDTLTGRFDCATFASTAPFLSFNSTRQVGGTWGGTSSAAVNKNNTYFVGTSTGTIFINDGRREGYWLGTVSSDWFTAGNWHDDIVPTSTTEVVIEDMSTNAPVLNGTGDCGNIIIFPGAQLTLQGSSTLNVYLEMFNSGLLIPNTSIVVFRRTTGITRALARPDGVNPDFHQVQYTGTGTLRFQTSVPTPIELTGTLQNTGGGTIDFLGKDFNAGALDGNGTLTNTGAFPTVLTLDAASGTTSFTGNILNGASGLSIVKTGAATQTLSGTNTYANGTTLSGGTLRLLDNAAALGSGDLTINGTTPILELSRSTGGSLTFANNVTVAANATIRSNTNTVGAGSAFTMGTLSIGAQTLTIEGGANVNSGTASMAFGATTHTGTPTYTVNNPAGGGITQFSLGTLTGSTFATTVNGSGEMLQSGPWTIATAANASAITYNGTGRLILNQANALSDRITITSGTVVATANAAALGTASNIYLNGGTLSLQDDAPLAFGRPMFMPVASTLVSDRLTPGDGVTHTMGDLTLQSGVNLVTVNAGNNITSGLAGVGVGRLTTVTGTTHQIDTNALLNIAQVSGNHTLTKLGQGQTRITGALNGTRNSVTTLTEGTLRLEAANALSAGGVTLNIDNGATLELAGDVNTTFNATNVLLRGASQTIRVDRATASAGEVTHTIGNLSWNANNLELVVDRGTNLSGTDLGRLAMTAVTQNTGNRTYNYLTRPFARVDWPSFTLTNANIVINHRGQGILGQANAAVMGTPTNTVFNQLGSGQWWLNGNNGTLQTTLNIDSGQLVLEGSQQVRIINLNGVGQVNALDDTSFALSMAFSGVRQSPRVYGSTSSGAQFQNDTRFTPGSTGVLGLKGYLEFVTPPNSGRSSFLLTTAPVVRLYDSTGLLISNAQNTSPVRAFLSQTDTIGRGLLRGDSVEIIQLDTARFDSLRLGGIVGFQYRIAFIVDSLVTPAIESGNLTVSPGPIDPNKSSVIFSVDTAIANGIDSVQITVLIQDIDSNKIINELVSVTQPPGKLSTITALNSSLSDQDGIARFVVRATVADSIDYKAIVQVGGDEPFGDSARVYFIPGPPFRLAYRYQPYTTAVDNIFIPPIEVLIFDSLDNIMWTDTNQVSLALVPFGAINGTTTATENNGVVSFPIISISNGGSYVMEASLAPYSLSIQSLAFDIFENLYFGGDGDGHNLNIAREQNLKGQFVLRVGGTFVAQGKVYDGTTNLGGTGILSSNLTLTGLVPEFPNVTFDSVDYRFVSPAVGENRVVLVNNIFVSGSDIDEYATSTNDGPSGFATIKGQSYFGGNGRGDDQAQSDTLFLDGVEPIPTRLAFEPGPGDQLANEPFSIKARLLSADGRVVPFGADTAILSFYTNPTAATLGGTLSRGFTAGEAVFNDVSVSAQGTGYELTADVSVGNYPIDTTVSEAFDVFVLYSGGNGRGDSAITTFSRGIDGFIYDGWLGGAPGNPSSWKTDANWSSQLSPRDTSRIIIPSRPNNPRIDRSVNAALNSFVLASGGSLTLLEDATLTIDSGTTGSSAANGPLFKLSAGSSVSTLGDNSKIIIEPNARYVNLTGNRPRIESRQRFTGVKGWRQVASPVRTTYADFLDSLETQGYPGAKYDSLQPNILWFAETDTGTTLQSWRKPGDATDSVVVGRGHFAYVFNGAGYPARVSGGGNYRDTLPVTLTATGFEPDLSSDFVFPELTYTPRSLSTIADTVGGNRFFLDENVADQGWNLLGNPTPSVLNWDQSGGAWTATNLNNTFYIWDPAFANGEGGYRYWNGTIGNVNDTTLETGFLAPWQAFWVHANDVNPELRVNNSAKSDSSQRFYSRTQNKPPHVAFKVQGAGMEADAFVSFGWEGITGPDRYDAYQLESYNDNWLMLYSQSSVQHRKPLVINHLPDQFDAELAIPLQLSAARERSPLSGNYSLSWKVSDNWPANWGLALMDHYSEKVIPLDRVNRHEFTYQAPVQPAARMSQEEGDFRTPTAVMHQKQGNDPNPTLRQQREPQRPFTLVVLPNYTGEPIAYRPDHAYLYPPAPNPFGTETKLAFYLPSSGKINLEVTDMYGRMVSRLVEQEFTAGTHELLWATERLNAGTYVIRLVTSDFVSTQKGVKVK